MAHHHTLEIRDRFGNILDSSAEGGFSVSLVGSPDPRAGVDAEEPVTIGVTISNHTDANGKLTATFTPSIAGSYVMTNEYTGRGGLLATFFRTMDFTDPVLENPAHYIEVKPEFSRMHRLSSTVE